MIFADAVFHRKMRAATLGYFVFAVPSAFPQGTLVNLNALPSYGITISNLTSGSSIVIENDPCCNPQTVMEETNPSLGVVSYTLNFMPPLSDLKFSRAAITLGTPVHPAWTATIYAGSTVVGSESEGFLYLPAPSPSHDFDIAAPGITSMVVTSNNGHFAAFTSAVLDNFIISRACQLNRSDVTSFAGTPFSRDGKPLSINATFSPKDTNGIPIALIAKAAACNFDYFNWQQEVVSMPSPSPFKPATPSAINPLNVSTDGSLTAPPPFFDPPPGNGYRLLDTEGQFVDAFDDAYPFYWNSSELLGGYLHCTPHPPTPIESLNGFDLRFQDCPGDSLLPNGAAVKFHTSLVGISTNGPPTLGTPLWWFDWESTFTGNAVYPSTGTGGVSQLKSIFPIDPTSGTGGVTITTINGVPQTPPTTTCGVSPNSLWPPNGKPVPVTVSGYMIPGTQTVLPGGTTFFVTDEYGVVQPSGSFELGAGGSYSFEVSVVAARNGNDLDGRTYTITVIGQDTIGNVGSCSTVVTVPHDQSQ